MELEALYAAVRALLGAAHKVGSLSEADRDAHLAALQGEDPGHAAAVDAAQRAQEAAERAEYERLQAKYSGSASTVATPGGGFYQAPEGGNDA